MQELIYLIYGALKIGKPLIRTKRKRQKLLDNLTIEMT